VKNQTPKALFTSQKTLRGARLCSSHLPSQLPRLISRGELNHGVRTASRDAGQPLDRGCARVQHRVRQRHVPVSTAVWRRNTLPPSRLCRHPFKRILRRWRWWWPPRPSPPVSSCTLTP